MRISSRYFIMLLAIGGLFSGAASAAALQFNISTTVSLADDSYDGPYQMGDTITGTFIVDDDTANGGPGSDPGPGANPGHEYTSL